MEHEDCHQLLDSLSEFVDGDLEAELCAALERHMTGCENCRVVVDTLRKTVSLYHATADDPEVPSEVRERLFRRLDLNEFLKMDDARRKYDGKIIE
jgi:anti-sigma factor (TIGR02949 family)